MQAVGRRYVRYFNDRYQRTGGLFEGRYRSLMVDDERYWFTCMRYIELNPVRAGLADTPEAYPWSSDRERSWRGLCGAPLTDDELAEIRAAVTRGRIPDRVVFPDTAGV